LVSAARVAVTEHGAPALPVGVRVEPETVQEPVVENERAPLPVPPVAVNANVEPKLTLAEDVIVTAAWVAPEIVPHRRPILSIIDPTYADMPTATMPVGHVMVSR
jgi:hypothetical protein